MPKLYGTFLALTGQVTILLLVLVGVARAEVPIEKLSINAQLTSSGQVEITQKVSFITPAQLNWKLFSDARNLIVNADGEVLNNSAIKERSRSGVITVSSEEFAREWIVNYQATGTLLRHNNRDQFFLKIFDQPGVPIYSTQLNFHLPESAVKKTHLNGNLYSLLGVESPKSVVVSQRQINFSADYSSPTALVTVTANWDKGIISLSTLENARLSLGELDAAPWVAFGLLLPIAGLLTLIFTLLGQKRQERSSNIVTDKLPSALPAILVGVLVRKKIYPEEIAALIIDLCQRGYLIIVKRSGTYYLAQRKQLDGNIAEWEARIIKEMFGKESSFSREQLESIGSNKLYSPAVREAFRSIYEVITGLSYFRENPHSTRIRNKLFALAIYYLAAFGMIWVAVSNASPFLILPLAGAMICGLIIIKLTPRLAMYTEGGLAQRKNWQEFGNYLKENKPLPFESARNHTFEKYLPYAVALGVTLQWARRFDLSSISLIKPDWFVTYEESSSVELAKDIAGFTNQISEGISSLRGPLVS